MEVVDELVSWFMHISNSKQFYKNNTHFSHYKCVYKTSANCSTLLTIYAVAMWCEQGQSEYMLSLDTYEPWKVQWALCVYRGCTHLGNACITHSYNADHFYCSWEVPVICDYNVWKSLTICTELHKGVMCFWKEIIWACLLFSHCKSSGGNLKVTFLIYIFLSLVNLWKVCSGYFQHLNPEKPKSWREPVGYVNYITNPHLHNKFLKCVSDICLCTSHVENMCKITASLSMSTNNHLHWITMISEKSWLLHLALEVAIWPIKKDLVNWQVKYWIHLTICF